MIENKGMVVGVQHLLNKKYHIEYWEKEGIKNILLWGYGVEVRRLDNTL